MAALYLTYLRDACERIFSIENSSPVLGLKQYHLIFSIACRTATRLEKENDFFADIGKLKERKEGNEEHYQNIIGDVQHFVDRFLPAEKKTLVRAGLSSQAAEDLVKAATKLREEIRKQDLDLWEVRSALSKLKNCVCFIAEDFENFINKEQRRQRNQAYARQCFLGIGGMLMIGVNASHDIITLSTVGTAVSAAVGTALIGNAAKILTDGVSGCG